VFITGHKFSITGFVFQSFSTYGADRFRRIVIKF
jgi:hypothetical protein